MAMTITGDYVNVITVGLCENEYRRTRVAVVQLSGDLQWEWMNARNNHKYDTDAVCKERTGLTYRQYEDRQKEKREIVERKIFDFLGWDVGNDWHTVTDTEAMNLYTVVWSRSLMKSGENNE